MLLSDFVTPILIAAPHIIPKSFYEAEQGDQTLAEYFGRTGYQVQSGPVPVAPTMTKKPLLWYQYQTGNCPRATYPDITGDQVCARSLVRKADSSGLAIYYEAFINREQGGVEKWGEETVPVLQGRYLIPRKGEGDKTEYTVRKYSGDKVPMVVGQECLFTRGQYYPIGCEIES